MERWRKITAVPVYSISDRGRVVNDRTGQILKAQQDSLHWYYKVDLWYNGQHHRFYVHRLVAIAFLGTPFGKTDVNHIDGNKTNNFVGNLEWITKSRNMQHAYKNGLIRQREIVIVETGESFLGLTAVADYIGGQPGHVLQCLQGTRKTHKGFTFEYID